MDRWGRSGPVEGGAGQGGSGGQKNFLVGLGLLAPPSSSPTPLNDSFLRAYVRTYLRKPRLQRVRTYVRTYASTPQTLEECGRGGRESREEGKRDHGKILTYERTYLRGNGGAAVAASRGAVLGEDKSALPSLSTPGTSCRTPASFVALMPKKGFATDEEEHVLSSGLGFFVAH